MGLRTDVLISKSKLFSESWWTRQNRFKKMAILKGGVDGFNYFSFILFFNQAHL
jgi:hypothetical protein